MAQVTGGMQVLDRAFINTVQNTQGRAVLLSGTDGYITLPSGDNPATLPIGVSQEGNAAAIPESCRLLGSELVQLGGTATQAQLAVVLNTGTVKNIVTNATPAQQTILGQFLSSGATGDLVEVFIRPMFVTK